MNNDSEQQKQQQAAADEREQELVRLEYQHPSAPYQVMLHANDFTDILLAQSDRTRCDAIANRIGIRPCAVKILESFSSNGPVVLTQFPTYAYYRKALDDWPLSSLGKCSLTACTRACINVDLKPDNTCLKKLLNDLSVLSMYHPCLVNLKNLFKSKDLIELRRLLTYAIFLNRKWHRGNSYDLFSAQFQKSLSDKQSNQFTSRRFTNANDMPKQDENKAVILNDQCDSSQLIYFHKKFRRLMYHKIEQINATD